MAIEQDKLGELLGTFVTELGAAIAAGNIVVGYRLGLYRGLVGAPATADQLAHARSQPGGYTLDAQAGEAAIRRATETPLNAIHEARP